MTAIPMIARGLTATDEQSIIALGYKLLHEGIAGASIRVDCDDGERMVAILNPDNDDILFAFGRNGDGYYIVDWDGYPVIECCGSLGEALLVFDCGVANRKEIARRNSDVVSDSG